MSRSKDLAKNTVILFIGTLCTKLVSFLLLPLYTSVLSTSEYGIYELLNTLVSLLVPLINFQLDQAVFRFLIDNRDDLKQKKKIISTVVYFLLLFNIFVFCGFLLISPIISNSYKFYLAFNVLINGISIVFLQISRGLGNNIDYSISNFLVAFSTIILNILFLVGLNYGIEALLVSTIIGHLLGIIYIIFRVKIYKYISLKYFNLAILKNMLKYSLPLIPNALSWWIFSVSDRIIVSIVLDVSYTGILSVAYKFSNLYIILYNIFYMSFTENISLHINDEDINDYFNRMFKYIVDVFLIIAILMMLGLPVLFKVMVNSNFSQAYSLIPIALFASVFQVVVGLLGSIYIAKNNTKSIASSSIFTAIVNLVSHLLLIKYIGIYAAVVSTLISYLVFTIYRYVDVSKSYFKISLLSKTFIINFILLIFSFFVYYINNIYISLLCIVIFMMYVFYFNKNFVDFIFNFIKKKVKK